VFKDQPIPKQYQDAFQEFESQKAQIAGLTPSNWRKTAELLEALKITELTRQTPAEALYDTLVRFDNTGTRHLPNAYAWTRRRASDGDLVSVGAFLFGGLYVLRWSPRGAVGGMGVVLSR
jgi:hypothetical protein